MLLLVPPQNTSRRHGSAVCGMTRHPRHRPAPPRGMLPFAPMCPRVLACTQVRTMQPDVAECLEADSLELMEMILGALGRDAVGLGARWVGCVCGGGGWARAPSVGLGAEGGGAGAVSQGCGTAWWGWGEA